MPTVLTLALMSNDVYNARGAGGIAGYERLRSIPQLERHNRTENFFGGAYVAGDTGIIAFRGSQELSDWTDADLDIGWHKTHPVDQLGDAFSFFSAAIEVLGKRGCKRFIVTGHSLGGGLTQIVAARITTRPVVGVTFNAPGMGSLRSSLKLPIENLRNVYNYRAAGDIVSLSGAHIGRPPVTVENAGYHPLGPLIDALIATPTGGIRH